MAEYFRLSRVRLRAGRSLEAPPAEFAPGHVTVVVGPNNSGKSVLLRELQEWATPSEPPNLEPWNPRLVVSDVEAIWPPDEETLLASFKSRVVPDATPAVGRAVIYSFDASTQGGGQAQLPVRDVWTGRPITDEFVRAAAMRHLTMRLDGRRRFSLADARNVTSLVQGPSSAVMAIWRDPQKYRTMRKLIFDAFQSHFVVNVAELPQLTMALSAEPPPEGIENSLEPQVLDYQRRATPLSDFSDGVQVYTGLIAAVTSLPHTLLLVDEPEAYLHPTLARKLGSNLARIARERKGNLFAATHSADFLIGCISEVPGTTIVRLTYQEQAATARVLSGQEVTELTRDPLLRSANALRALFAQACVICEADSDRAFYEEINRRLLDEQRRTGSDDTIFINAQNWQTIPTIAAPLRRLGIPAAMVLDLDTIAVGSGWGDIIKALGVDETTAGKLTNRRDVCGRLITKAGRLGTGEDAPLKVKKQGLTALPEEDRTQVEEFLENMATYGVFVVPVGELEGWLQSLGQGTRKQEWVTKMLQRLGARGTDTYVPPSDGDVWEFIEAVASWNHDPVRKGIPD